jgi:hypothetical protein
MRLSCVVFLVTVPAAIAAAFLVPYRGSSVASPTVVTLTALAASLWIGFSANRDARTRLESIKRAYAIHGDTKRLLREHWLVYLVVAVRLDVMVLCGLVMALWGWGPRLGVSIILLGGILIALTWPTARKAQLLLGRARALREDHDGATV